MTYKSFVIGLIILVFGLGVFVAYQQGMIKTEKLVPSDANMDSSYCKYDLDCKPYCGFSIENTGRGKCVNKEFISGAKKDIKLDICAKEYLAECNSCICDGNVCTTISTGDLNC